MNTSIKPPIRILLCGLGWWGLNWLNNIEENKNYNLVGVAEKNPETLNTVKKKIQRLYKKCGVQNKIELFNFFMKNSE